MRAEEGEAMTDQPRPDRDTIRKFLEEHFSGEDLEALFFYAKDPELQAARNAFVDDDGLPVKVRRALEYCEHHELIPQLLDEINRERPGQFGRHLEEETTPAKPTAEKKAGLPVWFWPAAGGAAAVLIVVLLLALAGAWPFSKDGTPTATPTTEPVSTETTSTPASPTVAPATTEPTKEARVTEAPPKPTDTSVPPEPTEPTEQVVPVPNLLGVLCESADDELENADLRLGGEPSWEASSKVSYQSVIRTEPRAGDRVTRDSEVTVVCSLGPERPVPDVEGKTVELAQSELEECGTQPCFEMVLEYEDAGSPEEVDLILRTDPPPGTLVDPGTRVTLFVWQRPAEVSVPQVVNMTVAEARERLEASFLSVGETITETSETVEEGLVIRSDPEYDNGKTADAGSQVVLVVSSGPKMVNVPNLVEKSWDYAQNRLKELGLQAVSKVEYDDEYREGLVTRTDPVAEVAVRLDSAIEVWVSLGLDPRGDYDDDGMPNEWEKRYGLDPKRPHIKGEDADKDGLDNLQEFQLGTNPTKADTDGDGQQDGEEDKDGDGLTNLREYELGANPRLDDTDGDGFVDGVDDDPVRILGGGSGRIAFSAEVGGNTDIYTIKVGGAGLKQLTYDAAKDFAPTWSPDGKRIAFVSNPRDNDDIYVMNDDGGERHLLISHAADDNDPDWSPDGKQLVFASWRDPGGAIYRINVDGAPRNLKRLAWHQNGTSTMPTWSPRGEWIAFSSNRDGNWEIYRMYSDGTSLTRLTDNSAWDLVPAWSPDDDDSQIVFSSDLVGYEGLNLMDSAGTNRAQLAPAGDYSYPAWSPDGQWVVYVFDEGEGGKHLYLVKRDGSRRMPIDGLPGPANFPAWQP
jgi:beta-lactam-binding protein with PASTA domain